MIKTKWKATPKAKIYEAWSAVADGRVSIEDSGQARVQSSDRAKTYTVVWTSDRKSFGANDNASYWVGYVGYPILAVLMRLDLLQYDEEIVREFRDINWNKLNQIYKRRYDEVVEYVISQIEKSGRGSSQQIKAHADEMFAKFKALGLGRVKPPGEPPKRA